MNRYGLRYKDAAHRLFLSETARIQAFDDAMMSSADAVHALQADMLKALHPSRPVGESNID